jgi:hypothetical protein
MTGASRQEENTVRTIKKFAFSVAAMCAALGVVAGSAGATTGNATTVTPAGDNFSITNTTNATLTTSNGAGSTVTCTGSTGAGTVPAATNNASTGSVSAQLTTAVGFTGCTAPLFGNATVAESGGEYIDVQSFSPTSSDVDVAAIGVNQNGYTITFANSTCTIKASPNGASPVMGAWTDGTNSTTNPSTVVVNEQIAISLTNCLGVGNSPMVLIVSYKVTDTTNNAKPIKF